MRDAGLAGVHRRTHRREGLPAGGPRKRNRPGNAGKYAAHTCMEVAWRPKPEGRNIPSLSRVSRCRKTAGQTADNAVLTLKILLLVIPAWLGSTISFFRCIPTELECH